MRTGKGNGRLGWGTGMVSAVCVGLGLRRVSMYVVFECHAYVEE